jgi:pyruvate/2-oxoglutarate dehydrogenase complex dihydrolipoamide acyltransferase (E2) component
VSKKESLQGAADEARKAARAAREFAGILDEYAKLITQPNSRQKADDVHLSAMNKLRVVNDGLAACEKWGSEARSAPADAAAPANQPAAPAINREARGNREPTTRIQPRSVRVHKRNNNR